MSKALICLLMLMCAIASATESASSHLASDCPSEAERNEERARLSRVRQELEDQYNEDMKLCYQKFDVTNCRLKARDRRIEANASLRKEELIFNAQERKIHAIEVRRNLAERTGEAEQKKSETERAAAIAASKSRADANAQKQIDHTLQGTKRGEYEQKQRDAAQHRADVEKKLQQRNKDAAAPLPVPSK